MLGKQIGRRALALGAVAQSLPDIDFMAAFWLSPSENLIAHRGFTHSFLFAGIFSLLLALLADRWHRRRQVVFGYWFLFFSVQLTIHLVIDAFNAYGVGWLEPFSHYRISFHTLFVADPFFSIGVVVASMVLMVLKKEHRLRRFCATTGLLLSGAYLLYAVYNKTLINRAVTVDINSKGLNAERYFSTPTPLNNWLWYIVAEDTTGYYIGYRSVFDQSPSISFEYFERNDSLLATVDDHESLQRLKRFSQGYYTGEFRNDTLIFNDLRFGQTAGWADPRAPFVFHYYLQPPADNKLVVQRGRFANWNRKTVDMLIRKIVAE